MGSARQEPGYQGLLLSLSLPSPPPFHHENALGSHNSKGIPDCVGLELRKLRLERWPHHPRTHRGRWWSWENAHRPTPTSRLHAGPELQPYPFATELHCPQQPGTHQGSGVGVAPAVKSCYHLQEKGVGWGHCPYPAELSGPGTPGQATRHPAYPRAAVRIYRCVCCSWRLLVHPAQWPQQLSE